MTDTASAADAAAARRDALVERLFLATVGTWDVLAVYVGDRLGLYRILRDRGAMTSGELADAAGLSERYVREWLEQQASSAILEVDDAHAAVGARRYILPAGHDEALVDEASLNFIAPLGQLLVACVKPMNAVLSAFRSGDGIPYADYGTDLHEGQARFTRPMFDALLATEWLGAIPEVHERLLADPPARVADVACGEGHSTIAIAHGYPKVRVDGIDIDAASIEAARRHLADSQLDDRVAFQRRDAADEELAGNYDLVYIHEALHDMSYPVTVLAACRKLLADGGSVIVGDERVPDEFDPPGDEIERFYYGFSIFHCLPVGMVGEDAAGTGTVMRSSTLRAYAEQAGFSGFEVLPIDNDFYRFYRLTP
ncbi:MAG TPA: class I SAM-dependent methyltransferase [Solirubrobacteraceae bacterium]|nr:class I SAM-dependent methyltransferase [Solirubrobacteraceae bacterium]